MRRAKIADPATRTLAPARTATGAVTTIDAAVDFNVQGEREFDSTSRRAVFAPSP
jgi:hypothetical protein